MKKMFLFSCVVAFILSCNNKTDSAKEETTTDTMTAEKIDYAYLPENHPPDNWVPGNQKNAAIALKAVKGWETGNIEQALEPFADSVHWSFDGIDEKVAKDTLRAWLTDFWKNTSNIKVTMNDYESVISKDKSAEWVTLWYKQVITDKSGKMDSAVVVDDMKFENGKIVIMDEKQRKFPAKKK